MSNGSGSDADVGGGGGGPGNDPSGPSADGRGHDLQGFSGPGLGLGAGFGPDTPDPGRVGLEGAFGPGHLGPQGEISFSERFLEIYDRPPELPQPIEIGIHPVQRPQDVPPAEPLSEPPVAGRSPVPGGHPSVRSEDMPGFGVPGTRANTGIGLVDATLNEIGAFIDKHAFPGFFPGGLMSAGIGLLGAGIDALEGLGVTVDRSPFGDRGEFNRGGTPELFADAPGGAVSGDGAWPGVSPLGRLAAMSEGSRTRPFTPEEEARLRAKGLDPALLPLPIEPGRVLFDGSSASSLSTSAPGEFDLNDFTRTFLGGAPEELASAPPRARSQLPAMLLAAAALIELTS